LPILACENFEAGILLAFLEALMLRQGSPKKVDQVADTVEALLNHLPYSLVSRNKEPIVLDPGSGIIVLGSIVRLLCRAQQ